MVVISASGTDSSRSLPLCKSQWWNGLMWARRRSTIEFLCRPEDRGVIAEPVPAKEAMPDWFKRLPAVDKAHVSPSDNALTVKRCMPFIDALTAGWILPLAATVRMEIKDGGETVNTGWEFDRVMISNHNPYQVAGHPRHPRPPNKFHNYWTIRTPPGVSCLFIPPLNRENPVVEVAAGIVDTDTYTALINFPFFATAADGIYTLAKGTPLVQVIPFRRSDAGMTAEIKAESAADAATRHYIYRSAHTSEGWYRRFSRARR